MLGTRSGGSNHHLNRHQQSPWKGVRAKGAAAGGGSRGSRQQLQQGAGTAADTAADLLYRTQQAVAVTTSSSLQHE
jgi:hypothetical protein